MAQAIEDLPEHVHAEVRMLLSRPGGDRSLRQAVQDLGLNLAGLAFGEAEAASPRLGLLDLLTRWSTQLPYTYRVDPRLIRGARPSVDKLRRLADGGCRRTVNLCAELPGGDAELVAEAGLTGRMDAVHVPVVDCTAPGPGAVMQFLAAVSGAGGPVYVHCEAGMGRTGVMVACYRIGQGWAAADARAEAAGFGCFLPDQLAFIETWTPTAGSGPVVVAPEALQQNRSGNADPEGLERALAAG